jgi:DNA-binding NarL/FixJ family response regulator
MSITILIADDHKLLREGFKSMIEPEEDMIVIAESGDGVSAIERAIQLRPDIAVLDITMPEVNGIEAARRIRAESAGTEVIILSMHTDRDYAIKALKVGAKGYLVKNCANNELVSAIRAVANKEIYLSPTISSVLVKEIIDAENQTDQNGLSPRERQVLRYMAEGMCMKAIAFKLGIGSKTVETYRRSLMKKLGITNLPDLTKYAIRTGIIDLK